MIEVSGLTKYYGSSRAIYDLNFRIEEGQIVGFLGLNGAGKSTALKILAGDLLPTSGSARVDGVDIVTEPEAVRPRIGFLPEKPPLYDEMTVGAFLTWLGRLRGMSGDAARQRLPVVLELCGLEGRAGQTIGTLSLGFRKRVGIAQAIFHEPALVILDEPISGLDPVQIVEMRNLIRALAGNHTVLISSHILSEVAETCDLLLILRDGELVHMGSEAEIDALAKGSPLIEVTLRGDLKSAQVLLDSHERVLAAAHLGSPAADVHDFSLTLADPDDREVIAAAIVNAGLGLRRLEGAVTDLEAAFLAISGDEEVSA